MISSPARTALMSLLVAVVAGLALGVGTQVLQGELPDAWGVLANSGVMWALAAFALGAVMPSARMAVLGGALQLVVAAVAYYLAVDWFEGSRSDVRGAVIWSVAGIVAGSVFGIAGHWCRRRPAWRPAMVALVAGVLAGEGVHLIWFVGNDALRPAGIVEIAAAATLVGWCLLRATARRRAAALLIGAAAAGLTLLAGSLIDAAFIAS